MPVAKSYQSLEILCEPYVLDKGRQYVKVRTKNGENKQVRWYTDAEYAKMYPEAKAEVAPAVPTDRKTALGFRDGFITIFKGDTFSYLDWFRCSEARFARPWGWYFASEIEMPEELPYGITPIKLTWEEVSTNDILHDENKIRAYVDTLIYDPKPGDYVGNIGERLNLELLVVDTYAMESNFGSSTMHVMEDADGNTFLWTTSSKTLTPGLNYKMKGTVKDHKLYKGTKQTILTRCIVS
jgi:hypothetical protein